MQSQTELSVQISLSEVLAALSHALDLTEGQPLGHTIRTCLIGMRIADELSLAADERSALYYALLLKDAGCSSNAARMAALFGSDDQPREAADEDRRLARRASASPSRPRATSASANPSSSAFGTSSRSRAPRA